MINSQDDTKVNKKPPKGEKAYNAINNHKLNTRNTRV